MITGGINRPRREPIDRSEARQEKRRGKRETYTCRETKKIKTTDGAGEVEK